MALGELVERPLGPGVEAGELGRCSAGPFNIIVFRSFETVTFEHPIERVVTDKKVLPILRVFAEPSAPFPGAGHRSSILIEGLLENGEVIEKAEWNVSDDQLRYRQAIGHTFSYIVKSVRVSAALISSPWG